MLPVIGCTINVGRESQVTSHHAYSIANVSYEAHIVGSIKCIMTSVMRYQGQELHE